MGLISKFKKYPQIQFTMYKTSFSVVIYPDEVADIINAIKIIYSWYYLIS